MTNRQPTSAIRAHLAQFYANRRILITGGASFIGSHLAEMLQSAGALVTVADDLSSGRLDHLATIKSQIEFLKGDLRDLSVCQDGGERPANRFSPRRIPWRERVY